MMVNIPKIHTHSHIPKSNQTKPIYRTSRTYDTNKQALQKKTNIKSLSRNTRQELTLNGIGMWSHAHLPKFIPGPNCVAGIGGATLHGSGRPLRWGEYRSPTCREDLWSNTNGPGRDPWAERSHGKKKSSGTPGQPVRQDAMEEQPSHTPLSCTKKPGLCYPKCCKLL